MITEDTLVYPTMVRLAGCLETLLKAAGFNLCSIGLKPGGSVAIDTCTCTSSTCSGMAWVRLVSVWPSTNFPAQDATQGCASIIAYRLEVGVSNCVPTIDARGGLPSVEEELASASRQLAAMNVMRQAIACCMQEDQPYLLETYTAMENEGGCGGGTWTVSIGQTY